MEGGRASGEAAYEYSYILTKSDSPMSMQVPSHQIFGRGLPRVTCRCSLKSVRAIKVPPGSRHHRFGAAVPARSLVNQI